MDNKGIENELEIINYLNERQFKNLTDHWKKILTLAFGKTDPEEKILCKKGLLYEKADMYIRTNHITRSFSIKSGSKISVHGEKLSTFCGFLKWLGLNQDLIDILKLYHYGDDTLDGTGENHYSSNYLLLKYSKQIEEFNNYVNKPETLEKIFYRFLSTGTLNVNGFTYYIYYGTIDTGIFADIKGLVYYLSHNDYSKIKSIHFGPFTYEPAYRGINDFNKDNKRRHYCNIKWVSAKNDIRKYLVIQNRIKKQLK